MSKNTGKSLGLGVGLLTALALLGGFSVGNNQLEERIVGRQSVEHAAAQEVDDGESIKEQQVVFSRSVPTPSGTLSVYFFDVGQADTTLLSGPDFTILIDAGDFRRNDVVSYLQSVGVNSIDLLVGTHPHADHIGQFPQVLSAFNIDEVWMSGDEHTTQIFERALDAILASDAKYHEPRAGEVFDFGSLRIEVLNPSSLTGNFHEGSVSIRAVYGDVAFLFTGDAGAQTESQMIQRGHNLNAQILQLGHHGSRTSSSLGFLRAVNPEIAIYSAGQNSQYGHPHQETVDRVLSENINLYGTAMHGTIVINTDGNTYSVETEHAGEKIGALSIEPKSTPISSLDNGCDVGQIDINVASFEKLQQIIHIGPARAQDLISLRPFRSVDSMTRISGIGPSRLNDIKNQNIACVN